MLNSHCVVSKAHFSDMSNFDVGVAPIAELCNLPNFHQPYASLPLIHGPVQVEGAFEREASK